jgi:hypothetical protein
MGAGKIGVIHALPAHTAMKLRIAHCEPASRASFVAAWLHGPFSGMAMRGIDCSHPH